MRSRSTILSPHHAPGTAAARAAPAIGMADAAALAGQTERIDRLRPLLRAAADTDLDDRDAWRRLSEQARVTLAVLVAGGRLPGHLAISPTDPPILVSRTLAAAWRFAVAAPGHQHETF